MLYGDFLYAIQAAEFSVVKIGISNDIHKRLAGLQCGHFTELTIYRLSRDWHREKAMHKALADYRVRGEWFRFDPDGQSAFGTACDRLNIRMLTYDETVQETQAICDSKSPASVPQLAINKVKSRLCLIEGCTRKPKTRGLCLRHYGQFCREARSAGTSRLSFEAEAVRGGVLLPQQASRVINNPNTFRAAALAALKDL